MIERRRWWWGSLLRPRDAQGRESRTLAFIGIGWTLVTAKFALDSFGPLLGYLPTHPMGATEYAAVVAALLAVWLGREWIDAKRN